MHIWSNSTQAHLTPLDALTPLNGRLTPVIGVISVRRSNWRSRGTLRFATDQTIVTGLTVKVVIVLLRSDYNKKKKKQENINKNNTTPEAPLTAAINCKNERTVQKQKHKPYWVCLHSCIFLCGEGFAFLFE